MTDPNPTTLLLEQAKQPGLLTADTVTVGERNAIGVQAHPPADAGLRSRSGGRGSFTEEDRRDGSRQRS